MQLWFCKIRSRVYKYQTVKILQCSVRITVNGGLRNGWTKWKINLSKQFVVKKDPHLSVCPLKLLFLHKFLEAKGKGKYN